MTSTAEDFFEKINNLDAVIAEIAVEAEEKAINEITYTTYVFEDGSKLTQGTNGFIGFENPDVELL